MTWRPCTVCGEPCDGYRCPEHTPPPPPKRATTARGYDWQWQQLSIRARRLQPFCTDCTTTIDLTADHLPSAWERKEKGLPIRLSDVEVVCRSCNAKRGRARPRGEGADQPRPDPLGKAFSQTDFRARPPQASEKGPCASLCPEYGLGPLDD